MTVPMPMPPGTPKPPQNGWGTAAGFFGFLAVVMFICTIWSTGESQRNWFFTGVLFVLVSCLLAVPGAKRHRELTKK